MIKRVAAKKLLTPALAAVAMGMAFALPAGTQLASSLASYGYVGRLGGTLEGGPDAGAAVPGVQVYVIGTDFGIYYRTFDGTNWGGWLRIPQGVAYSNPGAVVSNETDVFVLGSDKAVWRGHFNGTQWNWTSWNGVGTSDPDATSITSGEVDMVVRGTDNALWMRQSTSGGLQPWARIPNGIATSDAGVASANTNEIDVFTRGNDNQLYFIKGTVSAGWGSWTALGGVLTSGPDAVSCTAGHLDVVVKGTDNAYWRRGFDGTNWGAWQQLQATGGVAGTWTSDPGVACAGSGNMYVFGRDTSNSLTYFTENAT